jgi:hypothetical protein
MKIEAARRALIVCELYQSGQLSKDPVMTKKRPGFREFITDMDEDTRLLIIGGMPAPKTARGAAVIVVAIVALLALIAFLVTVKG